MKPETRCSKCGAPVRHEVAGGFCTACLLEVGLSPAKLAQNPIALRYFGDYELIEEIARGGMGVVFKARQRSLNRVVAVKMILSGHLASEAQTQRFRAEARAAAALQHPGIVAIHEVGEHEGLLFFSMAYVPGLNLAQQVRDAPWPAVRAAQCLHVIAGAIQYAHEQGVLHRDLKPSNVLIDANGQPHVTDFGLAKQLTSDSGLQTSDLTLTGQVLGSPNFMPPEQAAGKHGELTPAADVYSLGAILYYCLTGRPPFVAETLAQTLRMVAEQEPVAPRLLNASVPRDLETICLKCLEKDPRRRYATAQELADELGRFERNEPIHARPASVVLKVHRWCVRNKPLAIAGTAILALLLVVAIGSPIAALRINRERARAEANAKQAKSEVVRSQQVSRFLKAILLSAGPSVARGRDATVIREALENASERVSKEIQDQPEVQGDLFSVIGNTFDDMGDHPRAITNYQHAVASYRLAFPGPQTNLALALGNLGRCQSFVGDVINGNSNAVCGLQMARECGDTEVLIRCLKNLGRSFKHWGMISEEELPYIREAFELGKTLNTNPVQTAASMMDLARFSTNDSEALKLQQDAVAMYRQHLPPDHPTLAGALFGLGQHLVITGQCEEAERILGEALQGYQKLYQGNHPYQPIVLRFLAEALLLQGKGDEAESVVRQQLTATPTNAAYLDMLSRVLTFRSALALDDEIVKQLTGDFLGLDIADMFAKAGKSAEAEKLCREALANGRKLLGDESLDVAQSLRSLALWLQAQDRVAEAEELFREELAIRRKLQGDDHLDVAEALRGIAWMLQRQGKLPAAESAVREALAIRKKQLGSKDQGVAEILGNLAGIVESQGRHSEAEAFYREALTLQPEQLESIGTTEKLASLLRNQGKPAEAETFYQQALALRRKLQGIEHRESVWPVYNLASFIRGQGKLTEAETLFREALALMRKVFGPNDSSVVVGLNTLANTLSDLGKFSEAESLHREAVEISKNLPLGKQRDDLLQWSLTDLGKALTAQGKPAEAGTINHEIAAARPTEPWQIHGRAGRWTEAAASLRQSIEANPAGFEPYLRLAPILLLLGDETGYRELCQQIVARFSGTKDLGAADTMAKACSMHPRSGVGLDAVAEAAETAVTLGKQSEYFPWFALCKSMTEYRQEHFASAADWARRTLAAAGPIPERDAAAHLVLAMAQAKLKQDAAAHAAFNKGVEIIEQKLPKLDSGDLGFQWVDRIIADILLREAKAIIEEKPPLSAQPQSRFEK